MQVDEANGPLSAEKKLSAAAEATLTHIVCSTMIWSRGSGFLSPYHKSEMYPLDVSGLTFYGKMIDFSKMITIKNCR